MIEFIEKEKESIKNPTLEDVEPDRLFIDIDGFLCQKYDECVYHIIADTYGNLYSLPINCAIDEPIKKILPNYKIKFD